MALITDKNVDESGNIIMNIACGVTDTMTLNTANTYSDKNIVLNISSGSNGESSLNMTTNEDIDAIIKQQSTGGNVNNYPVRYYKIEFNELYSTDGKAPISAALSELEFYDKDDNQIPVISITADSTYGTGATYTPDKLVDGKTTTMWSSLNTDDLHWVQIQLIEPVILNKIKIAPRKDIIYGVPNILTFYASYDTLEWTVIGYYDNLKDTWVDQNTFQDFLVEPYKTNIAINNKLINFSSLKYYHATHTANKADLNSPSFTGEPTAETPLEDDNSDRLATTKFVQELFKNSTIPLINKELAAREHQARMEEWSKLGLGLFIHWGVFSAWNGKYSGTNELGEEVDVSITNNAEWLLLKAKIPIDVYKSKSSSFTGSLWNAEQIARMAYQAGMKYIVITAKHHEGFSLFSNPENSSWDIDDSACRNTVLQELKDACDKYGLKFCLYFSQCYDWTEEGGFGRERRDYLGTDPYTEEQHLDYLQKTINSINYLVQTYDPYVLWYDMGFSDAKYYNILHEAQELYWPNVITNDRLTSNRKLFGDFATSERVPGSGNDKYSEACFTLNNTWGYTSANDTLTFYNNMNLETIFKDFILNSLSCGQNCLLNIGPDPYGEVPEMQRSRLRFMSKFFQKYGIITGGKRVNQISYPDWGCMIKTNDTTLKCFVFEPNQENIYLYGFDPTYIESVKVYDALENYSYEITEYGIKLSSALTSYSYDEYINQFNTTITNDANLGVVEIKFSQPIVALEAKPLDMFELLTSRCFSIEGNAIKKYRTNYITLPGRSSCYTEFIWTGESGIYNLIPSIGLGSDTYTDGSIFITDCATSQTTEYTIDNLSTETISDLFLHKGTRYRVKISRANGDSNTTTAMTFNSIHFEPSNSDITYTEADHITAKKYQYIDTGFSPSNNSKIEVDFQQSEKTSTGIGIVAGLENPKFLIGTNTTRNAMRFDFGTIKESYTANDSYTILNTRHTAVLDKGKCYVDGEEITDIDMSNENAFQATPTLYLFADSGYPQDSVKFIGNIYAAKIWENDVLVRDFVPMKRDYDNAYGLLDRVNNKFYRSASSIDFTCE